MEIIKYKQMIKDIDWLIDFLSNYDVHPDVNSYLEDDYYTANEFVEKFENGIDISQNNQGRYALGGLHEMFKWIKNICDCIEFDVLVPHLKMLSESAIRINSYTAMFNPVSKQQDHKTNKLIETIIAMFAVKNCKNIELDDPVSSSAGTNPDVIFNYGGKRISVACKTLRGNSHQTLMNNFESGVKQIKRAHCDFGYVAINAMNIIPHKDISTKTFPNHHVPLGILEKKINDLYNQFISENSQKIKDLIDGSNVRPLIISFAHSTTKIMSDKGVLSTMLKLTGGFSLIEGVDYTSDLMLANDINNFIHNL